MENKNIRQRTVEEDTVLGARTAAFLVGNGFVLMALGTNSSFLYGGAIANFGLALSIIWMLTSFQSHRVIQALHRLRLELDEPDPINDAVNKATLWKPGYFSTFLGPTALIALWLPFIVILLWIFINFIR